jgi:protein ImuB
MKSRALGSATADLFATAAPAAATSTAAMATTAASAVTAAVTAPLAAPPPAPSSAPAGPPHPRLTRPQIVPRPAAAGATPPPHTRASRRRPQQLWYAAVFTELAAAPEPARAAAVLQRFCLNAQAFTPLVSIEMPNALLLEIKGSIKLFGSLEILHARIDDTWRQLGLTVRSATAPSTLAALWLARAGQRAIIEDAGSLAGRLSALPVTCTAWDAERLEALRALGVLRIGEMLRLPRAGMTRRFGASLTLDLDIALARQAAPRRAFVPRERFRERCDFEEEVETVAYLEKALEPLTARCAAFLRERQAGVQALELRLRHRTHPVTRVRVGLAGVTGERRRLSEVLSQRLSRLELAAPILEVTLVSGPLQPLSSVSLDVFAHPGRGAGGGDTASQLVERLRARLGEGAVYGVCPVAEHRPEAAWRRVRALHLDAMLPGEPSRNSPRVPAGAGDVRAGEAVRQGGDRSRPHPLRPRSRNVIGDQCPRVDSGMPRPVWLLDEPAELSASQVRQLDAGEMILEEGPERIESGWWDGKGVARDYYIARQAGGARLWLFQERRSKHWFLHGVFA